MAAEAPTEGCAEYPAPIAEYKYPEPQSWVQRRACSPGPGQRRVGCNLQQAPSTCAGTSTRGQRGKYGVPADPRLDPLALSHPSRRGSSFLRIPSTFALLPLLPTASYYISHLCRLHCPCVLRTDCGVSTGLQLSCPAHQSPCIARFPLWLLENQSHFELPAAQCLSRVFLQLLSGIGSLSLLFRHSLDRARCCQY